MSEKFVVTGDTAREQRERRERHAERIREEEAIQDDTAQGGNVLSTGDVFTLYRILKSITAGNKRVARAIDGAVFKGTPRHLSDAEGRAMPVGTDVRDAYLRVTLDGSGADAYWPMRDLMAEEGSGEFLVYDQG